MPANSLNVNIYKVATRKRLCRNLFFKKVAGWNTACNKLKKDSGTDTYFPMNFSQFFLRTHITENFQKTFMQKAASIVLLFKFQIFLQRVSYSSFHVK